MDGPHIQEISKGYFRVYIEISILIQSQIEDGLNNAGDFHRLYRDIGYAQLACSPCVHVYKYGDGTDDDNTQLDCLKLIYGGGFRNKLEANNFGQTGPSERLQQAAVEGHYEMYLCDE